MVQRESYGEKPTMYPNEILTHLFPQITVLLSNDLGNWWSMQATWHDYNHCGCSEQTSSEIVLACHQNANLYAKVYYSHFITPRQQGHPTVCWEDRVQEDVHIPLPEVEQQATNRLKWRRLSKEAKGHLVLSSEVKSSQYTRYLLPRISHTEVRTCDQI